MSGKSATAYILVTAILLWLIFGKRVQATVTIPQSEVKATYKQTIPPSRPQQGAPEGAGDENFDLGFVDANAGLITDPPVQDQSNPLEPPRFVPDGAMGTDFGA